MNSKVISVQVFTSDECPYCPKAMEMVKEVSKKYKEVVWTQTSIDKFAGRKLALNFGIPAVPAIAIDGKLIFIGIPSTNEFEQEIQKKISGMVLK